MTSVNKAALLAQKDREMESQLIKISTNAFPKPKLERAVNIGRKPIYSRVLEGTPEYMAEKIQTDRMLDSQLEKISTNATRDVNTGPPKLVRAVTQEMIDEYQAESSKPLMINGVSYKYHPVSGIAALNLDQFDATPFVIMTPDQKNAAYADIENLRLEITTYNEDIRQYVHRKELSRNKYDAALGAAKNQQKIKKLTADFEYDVREADQLINDCEVNIARADTDIRQIEQFIEARSNDQQLHDAERYRVDSVNKQRLNDATDEFNNLNTGRLNMEQNTNETDTEYLRRLQDVGSKPATVEEVEASSDIMNTMRAQHNLEALLSDKGKIGNIVKWMNSVEQFQFNKRFPRIKKKYLDEYGFNNKQITDREIYEFILDELAQPAPQAPAAAPPPQRALAPALAPALATDPLSAMLRRRAPPPDEPPSVPWTGRAEKAPIDPTTPPPKTTGSLNSSILSGLAGVKLKPAKDRGPKLVVQEVTTPQKLSMMDEVKAKMAQRAKSTLSQPADDEDPTVWNPDDEPVAIKVKSASTTEAVAAKPLTPKEIFLLDMKHAGLSTGTKKAPKTSEQMITELIDTYSDINVDALNRARIDESVRSKALTYMAGKEKALKGVGIKKLSNVMPFGKISINPDMLYYKNTLIIRRLKDNKSITGHKNIVVSDDFVDIIFKIINGKAITKANIKDLSNNEKILYDNLIMQSGLHKTQPHTIDESSQQMKKRVDLIVGEIQAGNSNKSLLQELHSLLNKMSRLNLIPMTQASQFYKSVKNEYF